jgi:ABC-2 type transport system permease protein
MNEASKVNSMAIHKDYDITRGAAQFFVELGILFRIQWAIIRKTWIWVLLIASVFPLTTLMFMKFLMLNPSPEMIIRIISGNMIFGVIIMGLNSMAGEISHQKHQGHFTFYASLPISKLNFILANLLRGFMTSFPSFIIIAVIGQVAYGIHFHYSWGLIPLFILSIMSIVGIGVCMGFWSPSHELTSMIYQVLMMFISFLSPIMVDIHQLPRFLQWISYIFPSTYAATALREALTTGWSMTVSENVLVMLGFTAVGYLFITKTINWRVEK